MVVVSYASVGSQTRVVVGTVFSLVCGGESMIVASATYLLSITDQFATNIQILNSLLSTSFTFN